VLARQLAGPPRGEATLLKIEGDLNFNEVVSVATIFIREQVRRDPDEGQAEGRPAPPYLLGRCRS
jgi:hypothetical protein